MLSIPELRFLLTLELFRRALLNQIKCHCERKKPESCGEKNSKQSGKSTCSSKDLSSTTETNTRISPFFHRPVHLVHGGSGINSVQTEYQIQEHTSPDTLVNVLFIDTHNIPLPQRTS